MSRINKFDAVVIIGIVLGLVLAINYHLLPALLAGMVTFLLMRFSERILLDHLKAGNKSRFVATILISLLIIGLLTIISMYSFSWLYKTLNNPNQIVTEVAIVLDKTIQGLPPKMAELVPQNIEDIKVNVLDFIKQNLVVLRDFGKGATHTLITMILGMVIGIMIAAGENTSSEKPLIKALYSKFGNLIESFKHVLVAQVGISAFNTVMTAIFLLFITPMIGIHFPFVKTIIILTFVIGLLPILGNIIVNIIVLIIGLSVSLAAGAIALGFLIFIHKFEYFLNAKIIGSRIEAKAWELLLAMLIMESVFGILGLIAAPIFYAYMKKELKHYELV